MFLLLGMLALTDLGMSTTTIPKVLCIFWFDQTDISFEGCLVQLFFLHSISALQSAILMSMAFDRYVAICEPLRYATILSNSRIGLIGLVSLLRAVLLILPMPILLQKMPFHAKHVIPTTYCEHMAVVKMVCVDTTLNRVYGQDGPGGLVGSWGPPGSSLPTRSAQRTLAKSMNEYSNNHGRNMTLNKVFGSMT